MTCLSRWQFKEEFKLAAIQPAAAGRCERRSLRWRGHLKSTLTCCTAGGGSSARGLAMRFLSWGSGADASGVTVSRRPVLIVLAMLAILTMFCAVALVVLFIGFCHGFFSSIPHKAMT